MLSIDLNCDMGEGYPNDEFIMPYISSVNIACGYHAGTRDTMRRTVDLALKHNVAIGAHPSYPDKENFGRIDILGQKLKAGDLPRIIADQLFQLQTICAERGALLHHVKPHGALYNRAAKDRLVSSIICEAIKKFNPLLLLYGLSESEMKIQADANNIKFVNEVFADRTYQDDASLTSRSLPNALIEEEELASAQALQMIKKGSVVSVNNKEIKIIAETVCIHGDGIHALRFAKKINEVLKRNDIRISKPY